MSNKISKPGILGIIGIVIILAVWFIVALSMPQSSNINIPKPVTNLEEVLK